ncbi:mitochondrial coenzyme A transporter SLC25A42-like [Herpailurus yagouaroundi]|uniref:mitochondrial coenzyme A transporter SLC25A42-like n=1 Tax=Herpailurus yagouaroundi TaxID=1608482 RepID=UPI001AD77F11|nr:mitochondrial coenzyme A transporter SLC25A42-like [Puma yagouaroundi]
MVEAFNHLHAGLQMPEGAWCSCGTAVSWDSDHRQVLSSLLPWVPAGALAKTAVSPPWTQPKSPSKCLHKDFWPRRPCTCLHCGILSLGRWSSGGPAQPPSGARSRSPAQPRPPLGLRWGSPANPRPGCSDLGFEDPTPGPAGARVAVTPRATYSAIFPVFSRISREVGPETVDHGYAPTALGALPTPRRRSGHAEFRGRPQPRPPGLRPPRPSSRRPPGALWTPSGGSGGRPGSRDTCPPPSPAARGEEGAVRGPSNWLKGLTAVGVNFTTFDLVQLVLRHLQTSRC